MKKTQIKRKLRTRIKIKGTARRPRLSVFRSQKALYGQLIDDQKGVTLLAVSKLDLKKTAEKKTTKIKIAYKLGQLLAKKAKAIKIKKIVFDRGIYRYHGRVKALATGAREGGLKF